MASPKSICVGDWEKRDLEEIVKSCLQSYKTNLFVIQIDVYSSLILYIGVEGCTNKDICVPGGRNTSQFTHKTVFENISNH